MNKTIIAFPSAASLALAIALTLNACTRESPEDMMNQARAAMEKKDYATASIQLKNVLQRRESGEARYLLATAELAAGDFTAAEVQLRQALAAGHPADLVYPALARAQLGLGNYRKIEEEFANLKLTDPKAEAAVQGALGEAYLAANKPNEARDAFNRALKADPADAQAATGLARIEAATGNLAAAGKLADEILQRAPGFSPALSLKAQAHIARGERADAATVLARQIELDPYNAEPRFTLISMWLADEKFDEAEAGVAAMKKALPRDVRWQYLDAVLAFRRGNQVRAREAVMQVLNVVPDHAPSLLLAGAVEYQQDSLATAAEHLRKVLAQQSGNLYARNLLTATYLRQGQPAKAEEVLQPALKQAPQDPTVLRMAGEVAFANNRLADAAGYYDKATAFETDKAKAFSQTRAAEIRLAGGQGGRAIDDLIAASAIDNSQYQADLSLVTTHLQRKDYARAATAAATLEKKQPNNPLTHTVKALVSIGQKDNALARRQLDRALEINPLYVPAARVLANLDIAEGNPAAARTRFEAMLAKDAGNEAALLSLAQVQEATNAPAKEVAATYDRAIKAAPSSVRARLELIGYHTRHASPKDALTAAQAANAAIAGEPRILDALGLAQLAAGETHQAIETFNALAAAMPDSPLPQVRLAAAGNQANQRDQPIQALKKALAMKPDLIEAQRGVVALELAAGRPEAALKEARAVQKTKPASALGYALEGDVLMSQKKHAEAVKAYAEGLKRESDPKLVAKQWQSLTAANLPAEAAALATAWLGAHPDDTVLRFHLANHAMQSRDFKTAAQRYREVAERQPDNPALLNNLALALHELNDPAALGYAEKAYAKAPTNPSVQDTYGWLLVHRGDARRGVELLSQAAGAAPRAAGTRMHLAKAHLKAGDKGAAKRELEAVLDIADKPAIRDEASAILKTL